MEAPEISFRRYWETSEIKRHVKEVAKRVEASDQSQMIFVVEECAELIKECTKGQRYIFDEINLDYMDHLVEESCDVLASVFVLLDLFDVSPIDIERRIISKHKRACERFDTTGHF